jgi:hypothetical protein
MLKLMALNPAAIGNDYPETKLLKMHIKAFMELKCSKYDKTCWTENQLPTVKIVIKMKA